MGGVTPHGIRYPDGASKAKNLGPELKLMAEDIDYYIGSYLSPTGPIRQIIIGVAEEIVPPIVDEYLDGLHIVEAGVAEGSRTTLGKVPMRWMHSEIDEPYSDTYSSTYVANRVDTEKKWGDVPLLSADGRIRDEQVPTDVARLTGDGTLPDEQIPDTIARRSDIPNVPPVIQGVAQPPGMPVFEARLALSQPAEEALAMVYAGSSTTAAEPGYVNRLTRLFQIRRWNEATVSSSQWSPDATFTEHTAAGIHGYSAGQNGTRAHDYLTDAECDRIAALRPAMLLHMVGANDYTNQTDPSSYETSLRARLDYLDNVLTSPCQHVLVQAYAKPSASAPTWEIGHYLAALQTIANDRRDTICVDLSEEYAAVGVLKGGNDPLGLISADGTHQTSTGDRFMSSRLADHLTP